MLEELNQKSKKIMCLKNALEILNNKNDFIYNLLKTNNNNKDAIFDKLYFICYTDLSR